MSAEYILNIPPMHNSIADSRLNANPAFIGGRYYQKTWGLFTQDNTNESAPTSSILRLIPGFPRSGYSLSSITGSEEKDVESSGSKVGLKTYTHSSTEGSYQIAVKRILEMLSDGVPEEYRNPFFDKNITKLGGLIPMKERYPKISFLFDASSSVTEAVESSTRDSFLKTLASFGSDLSKEVAYLTGGRNANGATDAFKSMPGNEIVVKAISMFSQAVGGKAITTDSIDAFFNKNPVIKDMANSAVMGYNIFTPKIWSATNFTRKYNISVTLTAPYSDMRSIVRCVYVPFAYILALALPRQASANSADAPFIISAHSPGNFTVPMGLITNMSIKKGGSNNLWTSKEGISRQITIQLEIADLYDILPVPYDKTTATSAGTEYGVYDENLRAFLGEGIMGADFSDIRISENRMETRAKKSIDRFENAGKQTSDTQEKQGSVADPDSKDANSSNGGANSGVEDDLTTKDGADEIPTEETIDLDDYNANEPDEAATTSSFGTDE